MQINNELDKVSARNTAFLEESTSTVELLVSYCKLMIVHYPNISFLRNFERQALNVVLQEAFVDVLAHDVSYVL